MKDNEATFNRSNDGDKRMKMFRGKKKGKTKDLRPPAVANWCDEERIEKR